MTGREIEGLAPPAEHGRECADAGFLHRQPAGRGARTRTPTASSKCVRGEAFSRRSISRRRAAHDGHEARRGRDLSQAGAGVFVRSAGAGGRARPRGDEAPFAAAMRAAEALLFVAGEALSADEISQKLPADVNVAEVLAGVARGICGAGRRACRGRWPLAVPDGRRVSRRCFRKFASSRGGSPRAALECLARDRLSPAGHARGGGGNSRRRAQPRHA